MDCGNPNFENILIPFDSSLQENNKYSNPIHQKNALQEIHPLKVSGISGFLAVFQIIFGIF
jgi:hypothetical protein